MLGNIYSKPFGVFEDFIGKNSHTEILNRNKSNSREETLKGWIFFIVSDTKSFMNPESFVTQSSAITHPYEWAIADVLSGKNIFSTFDSNYNELWRDHETLFDNDSSKAGRKNREVKVFSMLYIFLILCVLSAGPNRLSL